MELTQAQYERIASCLPVPRGNVRVSHLQVLNAILYIAEHGGTWRGLPERFGNWHTIYTRVNRWSRNGVLARVFAALQRERIIRIRIEAAALDNPQGHVQGSRQFVWVPQMPGQSAPRARSAPPPPATGG